MIGTVLRFKLKKTLIGIAALSLLVPMASHADVTKGRWIFDGFSRATREMLEALSETRREGGLGVLLANSLAASADYSYVFGRNRIRLTLAQG